LDVRKKGDGENNSNNYSIVKYNKSYRNRRREKIP